MARKKKANSPQPEPPKAQSADVEALNRKIDELQESQRLLEQEVIDKDERLANAEDTIARLSRKGQDKPAAKVITFEHEGKDYQFLYPAMFVGGVKMTADEIIGEPELLNGLIEKQSAAIKAL